MNHNNNDEKQIFPSFFTKIEDKSHHRKFSLHRELKKYFDIINYGSKL